MAKYYEGKINSRTNYIRFAIGASVVLGLFFLFKTSVLGQSTSTIALEPEKGAVVASAVAVTDANTSSGGYITFNTPVTQSSDSFFEDFTGDTSINSLDYGVWHRDPYLVSTEQWQGDHADLGAGNCDAPTTSRTVHRDRTNEAVYLCQNIGGDPGKAHIMTSMGDTSGYSIVWLSPKQVFSSVSSIKFNVNLTTLGNRKWWKVGVVSDTQFKKVNHPCCNDAPGFLASDVGASNLPSSLATSDLLYASWSGGASGGCGIDGKCGGLKIGDDNTGVFSNPAPTDKATRFPVILTDNKNNTITFSVAGVSVTRAGSFPACPCRVVILDHNYTPDKSETPRPVTNPYTWHWDDIRVN